MFKQIENSISTLSDQVNDYEIKIRDLTILLEETKKILNKEYELHVEMLEKYINKIKLSNYAIISSSNYTRNKVYLYMDSFYIKPFVHILKKILRTKSLCKPYLNNYIIDLCNVYKLRLINKLPNNICAIHVASGSYIITKSANLKLKSNVGYFGYTSPSTIINKLKINSLTNNLKIIRIEDCTINKLYIKVNSIVHINGGANIRNLYINKNCENIIITCHNDWTHNRNGLYLNYINLGIVNKINKNIIFHHDFFNSTYTIYIAKLRSVCRYINTF